MEIDKKNIFTGLVVVVLLFIIIWLSAYVRSSTLSAPTVLDYDPWWYYRHAIEIMNNNLVPPKWDLLSYYPPGRPYDNQLGWVYTMIIFYKIATLLIKGITFLTVAKYSVLIMVGMGAIPAFFLGRLISNKWGGLATTLFALLTPTFIGVSMAGYTDNDPVVVFYTFFSSLSILLLLVKNHNLNIPILSKQYLKHQFKLFPYYAFAIIANLLFAFNWGGGWFVLILFTAFLPMLFVFRIVESIIHERKFILKLFEAFNELKSLLTPILIVIMISGILGYFLGLGNIIATALVLIGFTNPGQGLLVNISVAELQKINILTSDGFKAVAGRIGLAPVLFTFLLPAVVVIKLIKKIKINFVEIFLFLWIGVTFYMILSGVRFSMSFSIAAAVTAGYVISFFIDFLKNYRIVQISFIAFALLLALMFINDSLTFALSGSGMEVSQNWIDALEWLKKNADTDSLITTWWDPGHIIAGYTGLKVMADGAHCGPGDCVPYNHNVRIQDMGRIFSTSSEDEAVKTLSKYRELTPQQCQEARNTFGDKIPKDACKPVTDIYLIASGDLIGKYYWLSYFGQGPSNGRNFYQLPLSGIDENGNPNYGNQLTLVQKDNQLIPVYQNRLIIREIIFFQNNQPIKMDFSNATNVVDSLVWVDPSFQTAILMQPEVRDSIFTRLYFWNGQGLSHFEPVFMNPEVKIFKVNF